MFELAKLLVIALVINSCLAIKNPCLKNGKKQHYPHPEVPNKFIQCSEWGQMFIFNCPATLVWVDETASCDSTTARSLFLAKKLTSSPLDAPVEFTTKVSKTQEGEKILQMKTVTPELPCANLEITNSQISMINGVYTQMHMGASEKLPLYKRSDDLRLPGIIAPIGNMWCITYTFSLADMSHISLAKVSQECGAGLECCLMISNINDGLKMTDPSKAWIINKLELKGTRDSRFQIKCSTTHKKTDCVKVPFCPPECLKHVAGCEVCECNGKPFFEDQQFIEGESDSVEPKQTEEKKQPQPEQTKTNARIEPPMDNQQQQLLQDQKLTKGQLITDLNDVFEKEKQDLMDQQKSIFMKQQELFVMAKTTKEEMQQLFGQLQKTFLRQMDELKDKQQSLLDQRLNELTSSFLAQHISFDEQPATTPAPSRAQLAMTQLELVFEKEKTDLMNKQKSIFDQQQKMFQQNTLSDQEKDRQFNEMKELFSMEMSQLHKSHEERRGQLVNGGETMPQQKMTQQRMPLKASEKPLLEQVPEQQTRQPVTPVVQVPQQQIPQQQVPQQQIPQQQTPQQQTHQPIKPVMKTPQQQIPQQQIVQELPQEKQLSPIPNKMNNEPSTLAELEEILLKETNVLREQQKMIFEKQEPIFKSNDVSNEKKKELFDRLSKMFQDEMNTLRLSQDKRRLEFSTNSPNDPIVPEVDVPVTPVMIPEIIDDGDFKAPKKSETLEELNALFKGEIDQLKAAQKEIFDKERSVFQNPQISADEKSSLMSHLTSTFRNQMDQLKSAQSERKETFLRDQAIANTKPKLPESPKPQPQKTIANPQQVIQQDTTMLKNLAEVERIFADELEAVRAEQKAIFAQKDSIFRSPLISDAEKKDQFNEMNREFKEQIDNLLNQQQQRKLEFLKGNTSPSMIKNTIVVPAQAQFIPKVQEMTAAPQVFFKAPVSNDGTVNSMVQRFEFIPIKTCQSIKCPDDATCAVASNCDACNPQCFPKNKPMVLQNAFFSCLHINCPQNTQCALDTSDKLFKCVINQQ